MYEVLPKETGKRRWHKGAARLPRELPRRVVNPFRNAKTGPSEKGPSSTIHYEQSSDSSPFPTSFYFSVLLSLSILHVARTFRRSPGTRLRRCENIKFLAHKLKDSGFPLRLRINFAEVEEESVWKLVGKRFICWVEWRRAKHRFYALTSFDISFNAIERKEIYMVLTLLH